MIKVNVNKTNNLFTNINITGHADYQNEDEEYDVVCAGVSSIAFGILNMLVIQKFEGNIVVEDNLILIKPTNKDATNHNIKLVLETLLVQLDTIAESYPKNIKIKEL